MIISTKNNLLHAAISLVHYKVEDGWVMEEAIGWAASQYRVAVDDITAALAADMGDLACD